VFDRNGRIFFADAPFYKPDSENLMGDYLPLFSERESFEHLVRKPIHPYEFSIDENHYFVDVHLDEITKNGERFFNLLIQDKSSHYLKFQSERSEKNSYKIANEKIGELNQRLKSKLGELEEIIEYVIGNEIKIPLSNLKSSLEFLKEKEFDPRKKTKIIELSIEDLQNIENLLVSIHEVHSYANSKTFEESYYCSLTEIFEEARDKLNVPKTLELRSNIDDNYLYFVNKFHISKLVQNLCEYLANVPKKVASQIAIKNLDNNNDQSCGFELMAILEDKDASGGSQVRNKSLKEKEREFNLIVAQKLAKLYNGSIDVNALGDKLIAQVNFKNLLIKTI